MPSNDYWTQIMGATPTNNPTTSPSLPTSPVADVRREQQTLGSGTNGQTNSYGNDMSLANQMNAQAEKMKALNAPALPSPGGSNSAPTAPSYDPFARPGDKYGDSQMRAAQYDSMLKEAGSGRGLTKGQRAGLINAAQGLVAPGLDMVKAQNNDYGQQMNAFNAGSLPTGIGGANGWFNADVMKGLFNMFGTNQQPGDPVVPGATATTPPVSAATTPAVPIPPVSPMVGAPKTAFNYVDDVTKIGGNPSFQV